MKRIITLFIVLCICIFAAAPVFAERSNAPAVTDDADIFSDANEKKLEEKILALREEYGCDVGIYTVQFSEEYVSDYDAQWRCEEYYNSAGFSDDGIVFMIFFEKDGSGGTHMATAGKCIDVFTDDDLYYIEDNFYSYLAMRTEEGYYDAAKSFVSDCEDEFYDYVTFDFIWVLVSPVTGIIIAFIVVGGMKSKLKTVRSKPHASDYTKSGSMKLTTSSDVFLYKRVTKTPRPKDNGGSSRHSGAGERSFGGHSGRRF